MSPEKIFSKQCLACATSSQKNSSYNKIFSKMLALYRPLSSSPPRNASGVSASHSPLSLIPFISHLLTTFAAVVVTAIWVLRHGH